MITDDDMKKAIANISRTPDGMRLYRWLQQQLLAVSPSSEVCALTVHHGERRFAAQLMGHMADAIAEHDVDGPDHERATVAATQRPVVFVPPKPAGRVRVTARDFYRDNPNADDFGPRSD